RLASLNEDGDPSADGLAPASYKQYVEVSRKLLKVERQTAVQLRNQRRISDELLRELEHELDLSESKFAKRGSTTRSHPPSRFGDAAPPRGGRRNNRRRRCFTSIRAEFLHYIGSQRNHRSYIARIQRQHQRITLLGQLAELGNILLRHAQLHSLEAAGFVNRFGHFAQALCRGRRDRENGLGLAFGNVDLLLAVRFRLLDHLLLLTLRGVDRSIAHALGLQNHGTLLAFGAHLLFHGGQNIFRRRDVLDLITQHFYAPRITRLVEFADHRDVDMHALFEGAVQIDLSNLAAKRGLRQLRDREHVARNAVAGPRRVQHFQVKDPINADLYVVTRDTNLLGNVQGRFFQRVPVTDHIHKWSENVKTRPQNLLEFAQALDDVCILLRHDYRG